MTNRVFLMISLSLSAAAPALAADAVKVFILAGQSNMEGHGRVDADPKLNGGRGTLEWLTRNPDTAPRFRRLVDSDGKWIARDDVQIWYLGRTGNLAPGFGFREGFIGPELGFGCVVGEAFEQPVLLIKLAWGGKSLAKDFRPPSSGGEAGPYYQELIKLAKEVLGDAGRLFPQYADRELELAGFGWHQGWNDRVNQEFNDQYEQNLANFVRDVRKDLNAPKLPFVIAETGMSGREETHPRALSLMKAQAAVAEYDEFRGNVAFVGTRDFFRPKEESPSGQAYHWNSNAQTYYLIGEAMGRAMLRLATVEDKGEDFAPRTGVKQPDAAKDRKLDPVDQLAAVLEPTRRIVYKQTGGRELVLHVFEPAGLHPGDRRPCFLVIHGGGWTGGEPRRMYPFAGHFARRGLVGVSVEYRLLNAAEGTSVFDCVKDGRSAVRFVRAHAADLGVDPQRIIVSGGSAGGHVAVGTALFEGVDEPGEDANVSCSPNALVLLFPVIDTSTAGYGNAKIGERWRELSPAHQVRGKVPPTLMFHGDADTVTPLAGAEAFREAMLQAGNRCELHIQSGGRHGYLMSDRALYLDTLEKTEQFLASLGMLAAP